MGLINFLRALAFRRMARLLNVNSMNIEINRVTVVISGRHWECSHLPRESGMCKQVSSRVSRPRDCGRSQDTSGRVARVRCIRPTRNRRVHRARRMGPLKVVAERCQLSTPKAQSHRRSTIAPPAPVTRIGTGHAARIHRTPL